jgi:hypothetical protein
LQFLCPSPASGLDKEVVCFFLWNPVAVSATLFPVESGTEGTFAQLYYGTYKYKPNMSGGKKMAGATKLELATSAVTALREMVLQQLTSMRELPNGA